MLQRLADAGLVCSRRTVALVAFAASNPPARRAAALDPLSALRAESSTADAVPCSVLRAY